MGRQLKGATVGIIGYGVIGEYLAPLCVALGMTVLICDPYKKVGAPGLTQVALPDLLAKSDFVICLAIANEATENLMNAAAFAGDEAVRLFHQPVARQSGGRGRARRRARRQAHRRRRHGCRPRAGPDAVARARRAAPT